VTPPRKLRVWNASLFALHAFGDDGDAARRRALRVLKRIDAKHAGALLIVTEGTNREFTFYPATLARLEPDLFTAVESLEYRIDAVEEAIDELKANERATVSQVLQVSRDIAKLRSSRGRAA
jgi:hypothetical protein